jgi:hypothetical protein
LQASITFSSACHSERSEEAPHLLLSLHLLRNFTKECL